jgi:hypothetical protein
LRGLTSEERQILSHLAGEGDQHHYLADDDDVGEEIRDRLVSQGRAVRFVHHPALVVAPGEDPNDFETVEWRISPLGRLALTCCTTEASS